MAPLNVKALQGIQKKMDEDAAGGNLFFPQKKIGEETNIRILPPSAKLDGMYFRQIVKWWVAGKPYTSLETFGEKCPITEYVEKATASLKKNPNPELHALLSDTKKLKKSKEFWIPILLLDEDGKPAGEHPHRVFQCGPACLREINKVVTSRFFQNDTEDGITDRRKGRNISLGRTGEGLDTEYKAQGWPEATGMPKELYTEEKMAGVDVFDLVEKQRKTEKELLAVIKNYLEGTPIESDDDEDEDDKPTKKKKKSGIAAAKDKRDPINDLKRMQDDDEEEDGDDDDEDEDEEEEKAPVKTKAKGKEKPKPAPADDDDEDEEDEDEEDDDDEDEDEPAKAKAKGKGKSAPADDDEDEDEEEDSDDDDEDDDEEEDEQPPAKAKPSKGGKAAPQAKPSSGSGKSKGKKDTDGLNDD